ncbi:unnamed protein product [Closterium sp. Naga37s-1]|nr:unnamed protein product [Closterium sp. Naga37s-1]
MLHLAVFFLPTALVSCRNQPFSSFQHPLSPSPACSTILQNLLAFVPPLGGSHSSMAAKWAKFQMPSLSDADDLPDRGFGLVRGGGTWEFLTSLKSSSDPPGPSVLSSSADGVVIQIVATDWSVLAAPEGDWSQPLGLEKAGGQEGSRVGDVLTVVFV